MRPVAFLEAFMRTRRMGRGFRDRPAFLLWQDQAVTRFFHRHGPAFPALADTVSIPPSDKATVLADFARYNRYGITLDQAREAAESGEPLWVGGRCIHAGSSTGTSGNRGYYLIDERERYAWLGAALGKMLPDFWRGQHRIAVVLPRNTPLYTGANRALGVTLKFFGTSGSSGDLAFAVADFAPDILIAAPRLARLIGDIKPSIAPARVIIGSEVADPVDEAALRDRHASVEQIYMATEGLIATSCRHGRLHLCEDLMKVELETVHGSPLHTPLITDFSRHTQAMVRYRMNDLLEIGAPCPCGSPFRVVERVIGRCDDSFRLDGKNGGTVTITPDRLRDTILAAHHDIEDFSLVQRSAGRVALALPARAMPHAEVASAGLAALFSAAGAEARILVRQMSTAEQRVRLEGPDKLRRVRRVDT